MTAVVRNRRGLSFIELIITVVILSVLGMLVLPLTQMTAKRVKELRLRQNLREIRTAIDKYKDTYEEALKQGKIQKNMDDSGYPKSLKLLVEGVVDPTDPKGEKRIRYLRRIPPDPFNRYVGTDEEKLWRLLSNNQKPDDPLWDGKDVFDVSSLSDETAIDGTKYKDW